MLTPRRLREHPDPKSTNIRRFMQAINHTHKRTVLSDLHDYFVTQRAQFWFDVFAASNLIHGGSYTIPVDEKSSSSHRCCSSLV
ncbi:hypothetical protein CONLIGDRAFT_632190, partial [Coniochaeta ligniaria NRRL 30616]